MGGYAKVGRLLDCPDCTDVLVASDGQQALDRLQMAAQCGVTFHVVLMDVEMPGKYAESRGVTGDEY
jgi:CheY-like chemotaxis protein